jgi:TonB family protein
MLRGERGTVALDVLLSSYGYVAAISVAKGVSTSFDQSAVDAAMDLKSIPAEKEGQPASQYMRIEYNLR